MSKSFDYCITAASNPNRSDYFNRDFTNAFEVNVFKNLCNLDLPMEDDIIKYLVTGHTPNNQPVELNIKLSYDANANFDYFTSESCVSDGTAIFITDTINRCLNKILSAKTYYSGKTAPHNGCTVHYCIGNMIVNLEHGDYGTKEKPWTRERVTVMLPIKYDCEEI